MNVYSQPTCPPFMQILKVSSDYWHASHRQQRLGDLVGDRSKSTAKTGGKHHRGEGRKRHEWSSRARICSAGNERVLAKIRALEAEHDMRLLMQAPEKGHPSTRSISLVRLSSLLAPLWLLACNTKAVAIQECREIEYARCEASVPCGVIEEDEVEECKRFYREQCLHGIAGPTAPTAEEQKSCLNTIDKAKKVATLNSALGGAPQEKELTVACGVISRPWLVSACDYLAPQSEGGASGDDEDDEDDEDK